MLLLPRAVTSACRRADGGRRYFWGWLNAVFNKVDHDRIRAVGPDRAAAEWLLRCGAKVRFQGFDRWHVDYNALPTGPLGRYKIQAIDATESCIMVRGFEHLEGLEHLEEIKLCRCMYIQDACLERLSSIQNLQQSLFMMELVSCGNVTDKGVVALHRLRNLEYLFLSDLPGIKDRQATVDRLQRALPCLDVSLDLDPS
ncbi:ATP synthase subunit s, mitochondrial [Oryzias melastigma]|uniref:ATP synthase subunit s, mitochondrial n=1 Tax=Oryzias melastigma TaxID=30732 RepID=A0A834C8N3_ORYME|nr:ATP synthase subunit s, mitochondrial [Oryzias melastigma]